VRNKIQPQSKEDLNQKLNMSPKWVILRSKVVSFWAGP